MPIRELDHDPRTQAQMKADEEVLALFEAGKFFDPAKRQAAIEKKKAFREVARARAAELGKALGHVRDFLGVTQEALAAAIGSNRTYVSRLESGVQGGVSVEMVLAICHALGELGDPKKAQPAIQQTIQRALQG